MIRYENQCCDCATGSYPCLGNTCPRKNVKIIICDICGANCEADCGTESELFPYEDKEICYSCYNSIYHSKEN